MNIFGNTPEEEGALAIDLPTLFTIHTAIDCIRYGDKSADFLPDLPIINVARVGQLAYSVIMRFEDNFKESYQDDQGNWQTRGKGINALTTPLYNRLHSQAEAAVVYTDKVFKTEGFLTVDKLQTILDFVQGQKYTTVNNEQVLVSVMKVCPVVETDLKFSECEEGLRDYIAFNTNVAIGQCLRIFKATGTRNLKKSMISDQVVTDLVELELFERGQMPQAPTPDTGEIMAFATDVTDMQSTGQIEVDVTDLYPLQSAQKLLALWWNMFDRMSDRRNLTDIMAQEARTFLKEKQDNPTGAGYLLAQ